MSSSVDFYVYCDIIRCSDGVAPVKLEGTQRNNMKQFRDTKYYVSPTGHIINSATGKKLSKREDKYGYLRTTLYINTKRTDFFVHRLVAELYCNDFDINLQVNHKDGNKKNNDYNNLEWVTCQQNIRHSWDNGLKHKNYSQKELNEINRNSANKRYSSMTDIEKEQNGLCKNKNPAFNKNYNLNKTHEQLENIKKKKQLTHELNKKNHLNKSGNKIKVDGVIYNSINSMAKKYGYSFKYVKRRVESKDYSNWEYV